MSTVNPRRWWALLVLATAQFMVIMDTSIIGVALPEMQRDLGFSPEDLSWVFNAYVIAFGGLLLLGGRLSDLLGARRIFVSGWVVLIAGSVVAAAATTAWVEIVGRAVQGVGGALIAPASMTLLMMLFGHSPKELGKAMALYGAAAPAGGTAGVFLGGVFTEWMSWPWIFIIYVPIGLATLAATGLLPAAAPRRGAVDVLGAAAVTAGLALAVFAVVRAPEIGWGATATVLQLIGAAVLLGLFLVIQKSVRTPLMPLAIWRTPGLGISNLGMALLGAAWIPMWYFLNLYLQQVLGYGAFASGAALLPMTALLMVFMTLITAKLLGRWGAKPLISGGLLVLAAGLLWLSAIEPNGSFVVDVLPASLVAAVGMSLAYIPAMMAAISGARQEEAGLASGIVNTTYQVGSALGLAALTAVATSQGAGKLGDLPALTDGFSAAFIGAAAVAAAGALLTALLMRGAKPAAAAAEDRQPVGSGG
ncbi:MULTISPECIES: MFS transporter [Streptomyces]|uniref:MFS transporter n=1 Tax=Streptomyces tsukubensis (strain DSM 42081 / NBRC 108919 / NRRL 18488 / 9993) TaxID=1114943 RepID=I2MU06_STRT9|nr:MULTISPECIES: MFS transporter [Streptomyces]AZK92803.1 MFS transporter [Streptomyces tsukubensis]EIF88253.1 major facilitator superfamily permease [Streptomyces tsukubensis NRRL18488]MYS64876.1 MFS transporter [Streptomyces sp. SID5473]QKM71032.1 MFS transporter [Streptomyces tsukubensis NRRL18488]TAI41711.1 MFS transporter [Streptomyces tsukubensis]